MSFCVDREQLTYFMFKCFLYRQKRGLYDFRSWRILFYAPSSPVDNFTWSEFVCSIVIFVADDTDLKKQAFSFTIRKP